MNLFRKVTETALAENELTSADSIRGGGGSVRYR